MYNFKPGDIVHFQEDESMLRYVIEGNDEGDLLRVFCLDFDDLSIINVYPKNYTLVTNILRLDE